MRIVVVGSGFGGLNAAVKLRKKLKHSQHEIIVISDRTQFVFRPSLIWLPFHKYSMEEMTFPLRPTFEKIGVTFIEKRVQALMPKQNHVICGDDEIVEYDYLILASGASPEWGRIKGLEGKSESVYDIQSALKTRKRLEELRDGEPIVIGIAQGNQTQAIAYEFLFELDTYLNERHIKCPITFFTYEKELFDGKGKEPTEKLESLMVEKQIPYYCSVSIEQVDDRNVYLNNGESLPYSFLLVVPPYKGKECIFLSKDLEHEDGILSVKQTLQSVQWENIYVVGDANNIEGTKTGRIAELQGVLAAENIVKQMHHESLQPFQQEEVYLMELGKEGAMLIMNKPSEQGTLNWTMSGMMPHMLKLAFAKYYLLRFS